MAHLTNYTFGKLCRKLSVNQEINLELFIKDVFNDPKIFSVFNKFEIRYLFVYKQILEDLDKFQKTYYQEVPDREDTLRMVFEKGGKLKYHLDNQCSLINNNFIDFNIPPEITAIGDNVVQEYRDWFKAKGYADEYFNNQLDITKVVFDYNMKFPPKYDVPVLNENYKLITEIPNSKDEKVELFDYNSFLLNLDHLQKKHENIFSCKTTRILSKFDYLIDKKDDEIREKISELFSDVFIENYGMDKLKNLFRQAKSIKYEIMDNLLTYFKWTYKLKEKDFDYITLEKFGLVCCGGCKKNQK
jgi:hypothetical protein